MFDFCGLNLDSRIFLAPLAGFSDAGFRAVCAAYGAGLTYTEMVSAAGLIYGNRGTSALLYTEPVCSPRAVQLFGRDPDIMSRAAGDELLRGFDIVDINMGCPVKKVFGNGDGSALMARPDLIEEIVRAVREGAERPVTVKLRAGIALGHPSAVECARAAVRAGAGAVTVHPRYREQMYAGQADHTLTEKVKSEVDVPVVANGDITDAMSYFSVRGLTHADAYMLGRGALGRPWIFGVLGKLDALSDEEIYAADGGVKREAAMYAEELTEKAKTDFDAFDAVKRHVDVLMKILPCRTVANVMKLHLCHYAKNTPHAKAVRLAAARVNDVEDVFALAEEHLKKG